jgi:D-glycero-alpha-D-manno-heptose-7-phosphate kinase
MARVVAMRAPTRMDFGGGWTDVPPYADREGGVVCAAAIARYATVVLRERTQPDPAAPSGGATSAEANPDTPLISAALRRAGAAQLLRADMHSDFPIGAGLGGSSAASAAVLGALDRWRGLPLDRVHIAERGRQIEVEDLGVAGGRQDHYCATHGGLLGLTFGKGAAVGVERLPLPPTLRQALERRCLLVYTGESRISGNTITGVLDAWAAGEPRVTRALTRMRELATQMIEACRACDVDALGAAVAEHWTHQRALHPAIPTPRIDTIIERTRAAGALGAKATGASGGGCVLIIARDGAEDRVRHVATALGESLPFTLDEEGLVECDSNAAMRQG